MLRVEVLKAGPVVAKGCYRVSATLYANYDPVPASATTVVSVSTPLVTHSGKGGGAVLAFRQSLVLTGVFVDVNSSVVFELHQQRDALAGARFLLDPLPPRMKPVVYLE